jgi:hypothetical protein
VIYCKSKRISFSSTQCGGYLTLYTPSSTPQFLYPQVQPCYSTSLLCIVTVCILLSSAPIFHSPVDNWRPLFIQFYWISLPLYASESNFNNLLYCLYITLLCSLPDISQNKFCVFLLLSLLPNLTNLKFPACHSWLLMSSSRTVCWVLHHYIITSCNMLALLPSLPNSHPVL